MTILQRKDFLSAEELCKFTSCAARDHFPSLTAWKLPFSRDLVLQVYILRLYLLVCCFVMFCLKCFICFGLGLCLCVCDCIQLFFLLFVVFFLAAADFVLGFVVHCVSLKHGEKLLWILDLLAERTSDF